METVKFPLDGIPMGQLALFASPARLDEGQKSNFMGLIIQQAILEGRTVLFMDMEASMDTYFNEPGLDNK